MRTRNVRVRRAVAWNRRMARSGITRQVVPRSVVRIFEKRDHDWVRRHLRRVLRQWALRQKGLTK